MKPACPCDASRRFPPIDYFFHSGIGNWRSYSSPYDGDEGSDSRKFHNFSRELIMESARERAKEMGLTMPGGPAGGGATDNLPASGVTDPAGKSSVYASVEKLGLKLESRKAPVEQVMVESIEKTPTEN